MHRPHIAIVGAGIAGLNAALTLQDAGLACDVYEAADRVGGRMHSDARTWADGMVSEWCGEFIDSDHTTIHQLIRRFGLRAVALDQASAGRAPSLVYVHGRYYGQEELQRDLEALTPLLQQQVQAAGYLTTYDRFTQAGRTLDQMSASDWIEQYVAGGHTAPLGRFLETACSGIYGLDPAEQSALNLVYLFGSLADARAPSLGTHERESSQTRGVPGPAPGPLDGRSKIAGGNEQLPRAMARSLPEGCLHLGHRLVALERADSAARAGGTAADAALTLMFATADGSSQEVRCDYAILALPFSTLRRVDYQRAGFDALKQTAIEQLGYGTISKLMLQFDTPYWYDDGSWPHPHSGFLITDLDIQVLWDASLGQTGTHGLLVDYTSGRRGAAYAPPAPYTSTVDSPSIQHYAWQCLQQLERVYPGISAHYTGRAALSYPTGDPYLLGSYACWRVGQYTQFAGYEGVRQGQILFAGEHCSIEFQGYMEGAAREGARAAQEILQELHVGASESQP